MISNDRPAAPQYPQSQKFENANVGDDGVSSSRNADDTDGTIAKADIVSGSSKPVNVPGEPIGHDDVAAPSASVEDKSVPPANPGERGSVSKPQWPENENGASGGGPSSADDFDARDGDAVEDATATGPSLSEPACLGPIFLVPFGALSISSDNLWGSDLKAGAALRPIEAMLDSPLGITPLVVEKKDNGWSIVGDPAAYIAVAWRDIEPEFNLPVQEITGDSGAIMLYLARTAFAVRPLRGMRRARAALRAVEIGEAQAKAVAAALGIAASGVTRDVKAAKLEREYPAFAALLVDPSGAPPAFYHAIEEYADATASRSATLKKLAAKALRVERTEGPMTTTNAKLALGIVMAAPVEVPTTRHELKPLAGARSIVLEKDGAELRVVLTFAVDVAPAATETETYSKWLAALPALGATQE